MDVGQEPGEGSGPPSTAAPWTAAPAPELSRPFAALRELGTSAGMPVQKQEPGATAGEDAGQPGEAGPASLPPSHAAAEPSGAGRDPESGLPPASMGSPSVSAGQLYNGRQGSKGEGEGEQDGGSAGCEPRPAVPAGSGKPVVRSREQFMRVGVVACSSIGSLDTPPRGAAQQAALGSTGEQCLRDFVLQQGTPACSPPLAATHRRCGSASCCCATWTPRWAGRAEPTAASLCLCTSSAPRLGRGTPFHPLAPRPLHLPACLHRANLSWQLSGVCPVPAPAAPAVPPYRHGPLQALPGSVPAGRARRGGQAEGMG